MLCDFNKVFHPTKEEIENRKKFMDKLSVKFEEERKHIVLVRCDENTVLYRAEPFKGFLGDCETCRNYRKSPYNFVEGGDCVLHNIPCGFGFVCKDVDNDYPFDYLVKCEAKIGGNS